MEPIYNLPLNTIKSISVIVGSFVVIIAAFLSYRQLKQASRSLQFAALNRLQELIDDFRSEREHLYNSFPSNLVMSDEQFARKPPGQHKKPILSEGKKQRLSLTEDQTEALDSLTEEQFRTAHVVINKLNDIGP